VQAGGRAPEVKLLGDGHEVAQLAKFHDLCPMAATPILLIRKPNQ
jgi:hypothetical protein